MDSETLPDLNAPVRDIARTDVVRLLETETVAGALARLRREDLGERIVYFYVTGADGKLNGVIPTRRLLLSDASAIVGDLMIRPVVSVKESDQFRRALETLTERKLLALPVVDDAGRLKGVLDVSALTRAAIDVERRDAAEEVFQLAGIRIEQERNRSLMSALRNRFPWLVTNIASGLIAAVIANVFDGLLRSVVALALFLPLLLTVAESVAMQSVTISLNHLPIAGQAPKPAAILREMRTGVLLGLASGCIVGLIAMGWLGLFRVAAVVGGGIVFAGALGAVFGFLIPRVVRRWRLNPVIASGPVTLAFTDIAALGSYFTLAAAVLR